jgi:enoyl-CoA hydratase/carnithine racemase
MPTPYETVLVDVQDHVATITLNRPDRLNALTKKLEDELHDAMQTADESAEVRVIVLTGAGRGFCAGADLSALGWVAKIDWPTANLDELREKIVPPRVREGTPQDFQKTYTYFPAIRKPILGAINGPAIGLGFVLPLYCDLRFASDQAVFGTAFAQRGLIAEHGVSWLLPKLIGHSNALDLLYSARIIDAHEGLRMGLVNRVVPHDSLMSEVHEYANQLATTVSPRSLQIIKQQTYGAMFQSLGEAVDTANDQMLASFRSEDFQEGVAHFLEKRAPRFTGR